MPKANTLFKNDFSRVLDELAVVLSDTLDVNVFSGGPGTIAPLPKALGGDSQQMAAHAKVVLYKQGFFSILEAKARFLRLPITLPRVYRRSSVPLTWAVPIEGAAGQVTFSHYAPTGVFLKSSIQQQLPALGSNLGKSVPPLERMGPDIGTVYHELTHFWLGSGQLEQTWLTLINDGRQAMAGAITLDGTNVDARTAFTESVAYHVDRRVSSWIIALDELNKRLNPLAPEDGIALITAGFLGEIAAEYDRTIDTPGPVWIYVPTSANKDKFEKLAMPLPVSIQRRIDKVILEDLPLSKPFRDTPLAAISRALLP